MSEPERRDILQEAPYFQHDELIGDVGLRGESYDLRLKLHEAEEQLHKYVLLTEREDPIPRKIRSGAASRLNRVGWLGDPRPGVLTQTPDWCDVPGGPDQRMPPWCSKQRDLEPFRIARYPVTDAQWADFMCEALDPLTRVDTIGVHVATL